MKGIRMARWQIWLAAAALTLAPSLSFAQEKLPPGAKVVRVEAQPKAIELKTPYDYAQVLLTGVLETGERIDVTRTGPAAAPAVVKVSDRGLVRPVADGAGEVKFDVAGHTVKVPVKVTGQKDKHEVSFVRDVMPTLSRMGCNAGTCHGAQEGRNGFQLSLRGYDPVMDHRALVDDVGGRRFNRAAPEKSLMLMKPAGGVPHVGGVLTQPGEPYYELLKSWISQGVKLDVTGPRVVRLDVHPASPVLPLPGSKQQMLVYATYSDGKVRDVTAEAFIDSSNTEVATVEKQGSLVTAVRRGETAILARYEGNYAAAPLIVMGDRGGFAWKDTPTHNWIDELVYDKLKQVRVLPSELCDDADFIRRVYLDLTGLPPTPEEVRAFLADSRPNKTKRDDLIDKLVGSPEYVEHWTNKWADLLQVNRKFLGQKGATAFRDWIKKAVAENMPYDQLAYSVLTASGSNVDNPPASYYKILREPDATMENTTHLFLAIRFNCNKCHDHPFERWTQDQYYHMAAFFAQIERKEDPKFKGQRTEGTAVRGALPLVEVISDGKSGEVTHLRKGIAAAPRFPFQHASMPDPKASRREQLAKWTATKDNPYFAKSYVNRVWSYLLGVGLIEPVDDIRAGNPPSNPKLLDRLSEEFIKSGFNVRELIKTICKSRTYQHSIATNKWNQDDEVNYSHALARRLPAEVLFDAIHRATGAQARIPGMPAGIRAAQLLDSNVQVPGGFLDLFGRPPRESACECERTSSMLLGPVLNLVNGPVLADALKDPNNRINKLLATENDDAKVIEDLYVAILCRKPSAKELEIGVQALRGNDQEYARLAAEHRRRVEALAAHENGLPARQVAWEDEMRRTQVWIPLDPTKFSSAGGADLKKLPDGSVLASGKNPSPETYTVSAVTDLKGITGIRLEVLSDSSLPAQGPGRANNGNFVLNDLKLTFAKANTPDKAKPIKMKNAQATFSQDGFAVGNVVDNNPDTGWAIAPQFGKNHIAVFELNQKIGFPEGTALTFTLLQKFTGKEHNIGRFRLSVTTMNPPIRIQGLPDNIAKILHLDAGKRTPEQKNALANYYRSLDPELVRLQGQVNELVLPPNARALGAQDLAWALINSPAFLFNH